ncbi:MAG: hypothetical protein AB7O68_03965 [Pirellulales bacterium]
MRFNVFDLTVAIVVSIPVALLASFVSPMHRGVSYVSGLAGGIVLYLLVSSVLYRRLHLFPMLLPRCPTCRDSNRNYWSVFRQWPTETIKCATCGQAIELWLDQPVNEPTRPDCPRFQLLWPYSFGGRWRRL